jgi:hypothetical protein
MRRRRRRVGAAAFLLLRVIFDVPKEGLAQPGAFLVKGLRLEPHLMKELKFPAFCGFRHALGCRGQFVIRLFVSLEKHFTPFAIPPSHT